MTTTTKQEISKKDLAKVNKFIKDFKAEKKKVKNDSTLRYSEEYRKGIASLCVQKTLSRGAVAKLTGNNYGSCRIWDFLFNHNIDVSRSGNSNKVALAVTSDILNSLENATKEKINALLIEDTELKIIIAQESLEKLSA